MTRALTQGALYKGANPSLGDSVSDATYTTDVRAWILNYCGV